MSARRHFVSVALAFMPALRRTVLLSRRTVEKQAVLKLSAVRKLLVGAPTFSGGKSELPRGEIESRLSG